MEQFSASGLLNNQCAGCCTSHTLCVTFQNLSVNKTSKETLVIVTHGFIKKVDKVPTKEIERAENLRKKYFEEKRKR
jgi:hypothetical protein